MDKLYLVEGATDIDVQQDDDYYANQYTNDGEPEYEVIPFGILSTDINLPSINELQETYIDPGTGECPAAPQQEGMDTYTEASSLNYELAMTSDDCPPNLLFDSWYLPFILWDLIIDIVYEYCIIDLYEYLLMDL